jgi:hypothetical protein
MSSSLIQGRGDDISILDAERRVIEEALDGLGQLLRTDRVEGSEDPDGLHEDGVRDPDGIVALYSVELSRWNFQPARRHFADARCGVR